MSDELKACPIPWCEANERGPDYTPVVRLHHYGNYHVSCTSCACEGPFRPTESQAITAWNTRTDADIIVRLREALIGLSPILARAESNASGNPEWKYVSERINKARAILAETGDGQ